MKDNVDKVLERDAKLSELDDRAGRQLKHNFSISLVSLRGWSRSKMQKGNVIHVMGLGFNDHKTIQNGNMGLEFKKNS